MPSKLQPIRQYHVDLVALHISAVCGHRCPVCYMSSVKAARPRHPPLAQLKSVVDALARASVREVTFLGGDPGIYPHAVDLARHCNEKDIAVSVLSNTHKYPGSSIEQAARYIRAFETTIHAPTPEAHDRFCGRKGAFDFVVDRLRQAAVQGRKIGVALNVTPVSSHQMFTIAEALKRTYHVPLDYIIVQRIIPFGRAQTTSEFTINSEHAESALVAIERIDRELGIHISVEDPFPLCVLPARLRKYMNPCQWGITKAAVSAEGDLSRCGADPRYRLGNVLSTPLLDLWNDSPILKSFRERAYLPGRCQTCADLAHCGGGCPLSCEIEKDHGLDYLFLEYQRLDVEVHGNLFFGNAREAELSSILQIEWSDFPTYGHIFSVASIREWFRHNPRMFYVLRDSKNWVMAYACLVPVTNKLHRNILKGRYSALTQFPKEEVLRDSNSPYYHIEVVASVPVRSSSTVGRSLIREVGRILDGRADHLTASPVTDIGERLCKYFGFSHVADAIADGDRTETRKYPVYYLAMELESFHQKVERF